MAEYNTDSHLAASCNLIAEELEAHAYSRAYNDKNGKLVSLDGDTFWSSADLTGNQTDDAMGRIPLSEVDRDDFQHLVMRSLNDLKAIRYRRKDL